MIAYFSRPSRLLFFLIFLTAIPALIAAVRVIQIPTGTLSDDLRYVIAPISHWLHAVAGLAFDILGPLQFIRVLNRRYGKLHRIAGRVFVLAGAILAVSGISLLFQIESIATHLLDGFRGFAGLCLLASLGFGLRAAILRNIASHRAWMIRAYAIGVGSGIVSIVLFPIFLATGAPPTGLLSDVIVVGCWILTILVAEWIIGRSRLSDRKSRMSPLSPSNAWGTSR